MRLCRNCPTSCGGLAGEPILARPVGHLERFVRWCRRKPVVAGSSAAAILGLVFGLVTATIGYVRTTRALEETRRAQVQTEIARDHAEKRLQDVAAVVDALFMRVSEKTLKKQPGMQRCVVPSARACAELLHRLSRPEPSPAENRDDPRIG